MSSAEDISKLFTQTGIMPGTLVGQNAVSKSYVDAQINAQDIDIAAISGATSTAQGTANTAVSAAGNAQSTANSAVSAAATAQTAANTAQSTVDTHKTSTVAHSAASITYSGTVVANNVKSAIDTQDQRISTIVAGAGASNAEILDARQPATGDPFPVLRDRLNSFDTQLADIVTLKPSGGDDSLLIQIMLNLGMKIRLSKVDGVFNCNSNINVPSDAYIDGQNVIITSNCDRLFYLANSVQKVTIANLTVNNIKAGTTYVFYFDGLKTSYGTAVKDIVIENINANYFKWFAHIKCLRKSTFNHINSNNANGIYYTDKSAEVNINNSFFIHDELQSVTGTKGIHSVANGTDYPEGLVMNNTLVYHFERNMHVQDLFIGLFSNVYFDGGGAGCLPLLFDRNVKVDGLSFNNTWLFTLGMEFGNTGSASPQSYRFSLNGLHFQYQKAGTSILLHPWVQDIDLNNIHMDSDAVGTHIGIVLENQNSFVNIRGLSFRYYESYVQCKGFAANVSLSDIPNADNLAYPFYFEYAVNVNGNLTNNEQEHQWVGIAHLTSFLAGSWIKNLPNIWLGRGKYMLRTTINDVALTTGGICKLEVNTAGVSTPGISKNAIGSGYDSKYFNVDISEKNIRFSNVVEITKEGRFNLLLMSEDTPSGTINGYHSILEVIKL